MRLELTFGDFQVPSRIMLKVVERMKVVLPGKLNAVCQWYKEQVASFRYVYNDVYPAVMARMIPIIMQSQPVIELITSTDRIWFKISMFDDSEGGYFDQMTPSNKGGTLGWWRFFEEGSPIGRNWANPEYAFVRNGRKPDGRATGFMVKIDPAKQWTLNLKLHPGVYRIGVFECTWNNLRDEYARRIRFAVREAIKQL